MLRILGLAMLLVVALPTGASAQSVTDLYLRNCATEEQRVSDGCKALRASMPKQTAASKKASNDLSGLWGAIFRDPETEQVQLIDKTVDGELWIMSAQLGPIGQISDGNGQVLAADKGGPIEVGPGLWQFTARNTGSRYVFPSPSNVGAGMTVYVPDGTVVSMPRVTGEQEERIKAAWKRAITPEGMAQNWGPLAQMAGKVYRSNASDTDVVGLYEYKWLYPGLVLSIDSVVHSGGKENSKHSFVYRLDLVSGLPMYGSRVLGSPDNARQFRYSGRDYSGDYIFTVETLLDNGQVASQGYKQKKNGKVSKYSAVSYKAPMAATNLASASAATLAQSSRPKKKDSGPGFFGALGGAIMGAATGYAESGGSSAGAIIGAMGGAVIGSTEGGNDALYQQMEDRSVQATADAQRSQWEFEQTLARARSEAQAQPQGSGASGTSTSAPSAGDRLGAQEQARAQQLRQEREAREAEDRRLAQAEVDAERQRVEEARRVAEAERNRPVEWIEGVVLCEPRANSKQWRCHGPLQMNILELDAPNTIAQLALACGGDSGIREIGMTSGYRAYGCGFGIHPTARDYPGNRDVPKDMGVYVSDRRVFHCPTTRDAYCRTP